MAARESSGVAAVPSGGLSRILLRLKVAARRRSLDATLAADADPWSSSELMLRASQLGSAAERLRLGSAMRDLVALAEMPVAPRVGLRWREVLEHGEALRVLAARLMMPAPVDIAIVAQLSRVVRDRSSPAWSATAARSLGETVEDCLVRLARAERIYGRQA